MNSLRRGFGALWGAAFALSVVVPLAGADAAGPLDKLDRGLKVGETIPLPLAATDQTGNTRSFETLKGERGLILMFNRSFDW